MDKRGQFEAARKSIYWTISTVVITMVVLFFVIMISGYQNKLTHVPPELQAELISLRFTNLPECFVYEDERVFPGVIDIQKFTKEQVNNCYKTPEEKGNKIFNFRFSLKNNLIEDVFTNNYFHVDDFTLRRHVSVWNGESFEDDTLLIYVQVKI